MEFSKEYHAAKKEIEKIEKEIEKQKAELKKKEQSKKDLQKKNESLKQSISNSNKRADSEILEYMKEKIHSERHSPHCLLQIEDDPVIAKINKTNEMDVNQKKAEIDKNNASIITLESESETIKAKISKSEEQLKSLKQLVKNEEDKYIKETTSSMVSSILEKAITSAFSSVGSDDDDDDIDDYISSYSSYGSYSLYGSTSSRDTYAEEAEKTRRTIEREAEETRRQMAREADRARRDADKAKWDAYRRQRDAEMKEFQEKQARDRMIDTRCRSCKVVACGMRFKRSNVNCPNYRPK